MSTNEKLKVIIWGEHRECSTLLSQIKIDEIKDSSYEVVACCNNNTWLHGNINSQGNKVPYITPKELLTITQQTTNYLVIVSSVDQRNLISTVNLLKKNNVQNVIPQLYLSSHGKNIRETLNTINLYNYNQSALIVCAPPKTGNNTIVNTLNHNNIDYIGFAHEPQRFPFLSKYDNVKILCAIREPINQILSDLFQELAATQPNPFNSSLPKYFKSKSDFTSNINNIYPFFKSFTEERDKHWPSHYIDKFMDVFNSNIINLYNHSFNTEQGYDIIKEGNIEVFVYQLEKLNDIAPQMSDWIGQTSFDEWINGNEASGKWINDFYKQAQKEIKFSQEFFDSCYNAEWVQHFYSQEDIEKFKERWRPHIQ